MPRKAPIYAQAKPRFGQGDVDLIPCFVALHDSTSPEAIAYDQRREVRRAMKLHGGDPLALSDATDLPVWTVKRRLAEILRSEAAAPKVRDHTGVQDQIHAWLTRHGPSTAIEVRKALGLGHQTVMHNLNHKHDLFRRAGVVCRKKKLLILWGAK